MDTDTGHNAAQQGIRRLAARLRFRHLELLSLLHQGASLRVAAQALHQTPPALSKSLREVEVAAGFALCVRSARGLDPTPRGERAPCGATHVAARNGPPPGRGGAGAEKAGCAAQPMLLHELAHLQAEAGPSRF